jgi:sulfate adenylyltransferase
LHAALSHSLPPLVPPHGGRIRPLLVPDRKERQERHASAGGLPRITVTSKEASDLVMLASGAYSPLDGFMGRGDYRRVLGEMRLAGGLLWPIPITLAVSREQADGIPEGSRLALVDAEINEVSAAMTVVEKFASDKREEARRVFGTEDAGHPGVAKLYTQGDVYLAGPVECYGEGGYRRRFVDYARPAETRAIFAERGWSRVAAFQTRNPIHRSHEYLTKVALEVSDGLLIHPVVGKLKDDDIPVEVRMRCYKVLLDHYYPRDRVVLKVYPMEMRYAGPREAVLHAIIRQNFGCSHLIIGRDHAGVGDYYDPFAAQRIFDALAPGDLAIQPFKIGWTFWCRRCAAVVSEKTCPHTKADHLMISGTTLREMLSKGERPPDEFSRPEVIEILTEHYARK